MPVLTDVQKAKFFIWNDGDPTQAQIATEASSGGRDCFVQINPASIHIGSSRGTSGMIGPQLPNAGAQSFTGTGPAATEPPAQQPIRALVESITMSLIFDVADLYYSVKIGATKDSLSSALIEPLLGKLSGLIGQTSVGEKLGMSTVTNPSDVNIYNTDLCCYSYLKEAMDMRYIVRFTWGSLEPFVGTLQYFETDLDYFSPEGAPLRANVTLGIERYFLPDEDNKIDRNILPFGR